MKRAHEESEFSVRRPAMPGPPHQLAGISPHPPLGLTSNHPPPPPPGILHPPPPPGISGPHPPPPGLSSSHPSISGFSHPVLAPTPKQLAHNFEQMRDSLPRPPFSATHITPTSSTNVTAPPPPPPPVSHPAPPPPQPSTHPQKPAFQTHIQAPSHNTTAGQQQYQRLKVEDALSYLDQVKLQFGNKPQVYNEFLDIMKEFKSQTIDTPGVISRVSALFKGHIDLIVGFNTFLPPGYKIEVSMTDINTVNVCAPTGTTTHFISGNGLIAAPIQPKPAPVSSSGSSQQASTPPSITTSAGGPPKSPTPLPTLPKTTTSPITPLLPLTSPSGQTQTQSQAQHHAINYVTKIKIRFQGQPEVYQKFLDILNNYQTEQKAIKENTLDVYGRVCPEQDVYAREGKLATEVYQQVAKLFNKQEDLLQEFSQFLPDATGSSFNPSTMVAGVSSVVTQYQPLSKTKTTTASSSASASKPATGKSKKAQASAKSESVDFDNKENTDKMKKRHKSALKDVSLEEAVKHGSFSDFAFFDKVRKALKSQEVYENFLRCLVLFNNEVISRMELIQLATTFLGKFPELFSWFKGFLGYKDNQQTETNITGFKDRGTGGELAHLEIDFASCKRSGASYRALPKSYTQPKCSGRTALCKELLNDTWVSLPSWSEDTQFPGTRKTQYEEQVYKCEDERFELDVVIEANLTTIKTLEGVQKKMQQMTTDEQNKFKLDNYLGGTSETIHRKAIYRIYGEKSLEIIDGLKKTPGVAIPVVLKRLKQKNEDWRLAQKQFNRIWRDQNEKYYLKSLDHQGINFKQNDLKAIRAKSIIRDIEHIFEERSDQIEDGNAELFGPHITFTYQDQSTLEDASALIIHHMKRQAGIHKEDKTRIKAVLVHSLQQLCFAPRGELSDDEQEEMLSRKHPYPTDDQHYNLFYTNNTWFVLLRMHQMLCERLLKMYRMAMEIAMYETTNRKSRKEQTAVALRLRKPNMTDVEDYYPAFLVMVKNLLDGHLDSNAFEDSLRESFGVNCYIAFTIDKLIQNIVRQLHSLVTEDISLKLYSVYEEAKDNDGSGGPSITTTARASQEMVYQKKVEALLVDENCFKIYFHKEKGTCVTSIELLPTEEDQSEEHAEIEKWSEYVEKYANETEIAEDLKHHLSKKPIFLLRNARVLKRQSKKNKSKRKKHEDTDDDTNDNIVESPVNEDVVVDLKLECKISMNTFKMRYVSGTRDLVFRQSAVGRSRKLHPATNVRLHTAYVPLHEAWLLENTTRDSCHHAEAWFLGKQQPDQLESCLTRKDTLKHGGLNVNKYSVVYSKELKQP